MRIRPQARRYDVPMGVTTRQKLDAHKLRADFPVFEQAIHGKPLAFLDSAVDARRSRARCSTRCASSTNLVLERSPRRVHAVRARNRGYEGAREKIRAFLNATSTREMIFVRQATEALNLVAYAWGLDNLGPGDVAVVTELEHHSNFVPWQQIANAPAPTSG